MWSEKVHYINIYYKKIKEIILWYTIPVSKVWISLRCVANKCWAFNHLIFQQTESRWDWKCLDWYTFCIRVDFSNRPWSFDSLSIGSICVSWIRSSQNYYKSVIKFFYHLVNYFWSNKSIVLILFLLLFLKCRSYTWVELHI